MLNIHEKHQYSSSETSTWRDMLDGISDSCAHISKNILLLGTAKSVNVRKSLCAGLSDGSEALHGKSHGCSLHEGLEYSIVPCQKPNESLLIWQLQSVKMKDAALFYFQKESRIRNTLCTFLLDWENPENFITQLNRCRHLITECQNLGHQLVWKSLMDEEKYYWESFVDLHSLPDIPSVKIQAPHCPGVLQSNLGVPFVVLCVNSEKILEYEASALKGKTLFIQCFLRQWCLHHGGSLVYCSNANFQPVLDYIAHRLLATPLTRSPEVINEEILFIPAGWDSPEKIRLFSDNLTLPELSSFNFSQECSQLYESMFDKVSVAPSTVTSNEFQEEQQFLIEQVEILRKATHRSAEETKKKGNGMEVPQKPALVEPVKSGPSSVTSFFETFVAKHGGANQPRSPGTIRKAVEVELQKLRNKGNV